MQYRQIVDNDYTFKQIKDIPETVAQAVVTRLALWTGEWFLNVTEGTPYLDKIVGHDTLYNLEIKTRILDTQGVLSILEYQSVLNIDRALSITCTIETIYGVAFINI